MLRWVKRLGRAPIILKMRQLFWLLTAFEDRAIHSPAVKNKEVMMILSTGGL